MFKYPEIRRREFGQFTAFLPLITTALNIGGQIGSSLISSGTMKDIASTQQETSLGVAAVQERIAQLQLQSIQTQAAAQVQTAQIKAESGGITSGITGAVSSVMSSSVAGIPSWILLVAGGGVVFMFMRRRRPL